MDIDKMFPSRPEDRLWARLCLMQLPSAVNENSQPDKALRSYRILSGIRIVYLTKGGWLDRPLIIFSTDNSTGKFIAQNDNSSESHLCAESLDPDQDMNILYNELDDERW